MARAPVGKPAEEIHDTRAASCGASTRVNGEARFPTGTKPDGPHRHRLTICSLATCAAYQFLVLAAYAEHAASVPDFSEGESNTTGSFSPKLLMS